VDDLYTRHVLRALCILAQTVRETATTHFVIRLGWELPCSTPRTTLHEPSFNTEWFRNPPAQPGETILATAVRSARESLRREGEGRENEEGRPWWTDE